MSYLNTASKLHIAFSTLVCIATTLSSPSSLLAEESDPLFTPLTLSRPLSLHKWQI